jgi:hypothetical protein
MSVRRLSVVSTGALIGEKLEQKDGDQPEKSV